MEYSPCAACISAYGIIVNPILGHWQVCVKFPTTSILIDGRLFHQTFGLVNYSSGKFDHGAEIRHFSEYGRNGYWRSLRAASGLDM